jgi:hypothetical protein
MKILFFLAFLPGLSAIEVKDIVARSAAAMDANWKAAPGFSFNERDVETKHGKAKTVKTYRVLIIEGSQYNQVIAINDKQLSPEEETRENQKLKAEIERRKRESARERAKRVAKYQRERQQDHSMMAEMVNAFDFTLASEGQLSGHDVWVLDASPKPGYVPKTQETKVLTGMKGRLWIEKERYQWVKVAAEVTRPISMYLVAKVGPGTRFELEQEPVGGGVWLPKHFSTNVNASALKFINEDLTDDETYSNYRPMPSEDQLTASRQDRR